MCSIVTSHQSKAKQWRSIFVSFMRTIPTSEARDNSGPSSCPPEIATEVSTIVNVPLTNNNLSQINYTEEMGVTITAWSTDCMFWNQFTGVLLNIQQFYITNATVVTILLQAMVEFHCIQKTLHELYKLSIYKYFHLHSVIQL